MLSAPLIHYVIKAAIRDRLMIVVFLLMLITASLSVFMGSAAIVEQNQFTQIFAAGSFRLSGVIALILFTVSFIRRSFEARDIEYLLSRPISRTAFLLSYATGLSVLAIVTAVIQCLSLAVLMQFSVTSGFSLWCASIVFENIIIINTALFFSLFIGSTAGASMIVIGFYVLCRMIGQILGVIEKGKSTLFEGLEITMQMISVITPRLDLMGQSSWLLYGGESVVGFGFILAQGTIFTALILILALIDFHRKQF